MPAAGAQSERCGPPYRPEPPPLPASAPSIVGVGLWACSPKLFRVSCDKFLTLDTADRLVVLNREPFILNRIDWWSTESV